MQLVISTAREKSFSVFGSDYLAFVLFVLRGEVNGLVGALHAPCRF
jgi:hypothetical protein